MIFNKLKRVFGFFQVSELIPTRTQWKRWTLPSKHTTIALVFAVFAFVVTQIIFFYQEYTSKDDELVEITHLTKSGVDRIEERMGESPTRKEIEIAVNEYIGDIPKPTRDLVKNAFKEKVASLYPDDQETYFRAKAITFSKFRYYDLALKAYSDGLRIAKNKSIILYERGVTQVVIHNWQEAEKDLLSATQELLTAPKNGYPKLMSVQLALAAVFNYTGNFSGALPYFQSALDLIENGSNTQGIDFMYIIDDEVLLPRFLIPKDLHSTLDARNTLVSVPAVNMGQLPLGDKKSVIYLNTFIMNIMVKQSHLDKAVAIHESIINDKSARDAFGKMSISLRIQHAGILALQNRVDEAETQLRLEYKKLQPIIPGVKPSEENIYFLISRGQILLIKERWKAAKNNFLRASSLIEQYYYPKMDPSVIFDAKNFAGICFIALGQIGKAKEYVDQLEVLAIELGDELRKYNKELFKGYVAIIGKDKVALKQAIVSLEKKLLTSEGYSNVKRAYLLNLRAHLNRMDNNFTDAKSLDETALTITEDNKVILHIFRKALKNSNLISGTN